MIKEIIRGRSLGRILMNKYCEKYLPELSGNIIDFGGGGDPSYSKYFNKDAKVTRTDYDFLKKPDMVVDLNKTLEIESESFDNAILFNTIYILENPTNSLKEINRILKNDGKFFLTSPFIFNEAIEPVDYWRFTSQGLEKILTESGFRNVKIYKIGERFSASVNILNPFRKLSFLNLFLYPIALGLDKLLPNKIKKLHSCPIAYFVICEK
jgi:SAM-dependent methyltransferase